MAKLLCIALLIMSGVILAIVWMPQNVRLMWAQLISLAGWGFVLGLVILLGYARRRGRDRRIERKQRMTTMKARRTSPPAPFRNRLAKFLQTHPNEVMDGLPNPPSKMPFWSRVIDFCPTPAKTASQIRRILERIREALHSHQNQ